MSAAHARSSGRRPPPSPGPVWYSPRWDRPASAPAGHNPKLKPATRAAGAKAWPKVWLKTWGNAPSYHVGNVRAGTLNGGRNYFYCQATGSSVTAHGYHNYWWALTDDDTGNKNVWVSDVYITTGSNDQPVPGLPSADPMTPGPRQ